MTESTTCEPLLDLATPEIYRRNLFRVLDVPVTASPRDVKRIIDRREMEKRLGISSSNGKKSPLALKPEPTEDDSRAAMERLNHPVHRLIDEIFWFWPTNGNGGADPALQALEHGKVNEATAIWTKELKSGTARHVAVHNLAVLYHLVALDSEARSAPKTTDPAKQANIESLWKRALVHWKQALEAEDFWSTVKDRVRDLNDVQLTTGFVCRVRATLPTALLLISAKLACDAAERSDADAAQRHTKRVDSTDFGEGLAAEVLLEALKPVRNRIRTSVDAAKQRWTAAAQKGNVVVRELYEQSRGLLSVVDLLLPANDLTRAASHDTIAEAMLDGQIAFGHKTNDWSESIALLQLAQEVAVGAPLVARLAENLKIVKDNADSANDWCVPGYWDLSPEILDRLEAARETAKAGNLDDAIVELLKIDRSVGRPLFRCLSYCLSVRGIRLHNEALDEYNAAHGVRKAIKDRLRQGGVFLRPDPNMPSWLVPPCLGCGRTGYSSWVNFTLMGQSLFMCTSCSATDDREIAEQEALLKKNLMTAVEYLLLANELDPEDTGVARNLAAVRGTASNHDCGSPNTKALRAKFGLGRLQAPARSVPARQPRQSQVPASATTPAIAPRPRAISAFGVAGVFAGLLACLITQSIAVQSRTSFMESCIESAMAVLGLNWDRSPHTDSNMTAALLYVAGWVFFAVVGGVLGVVLGLVVSPTREQARDSIAA